FVLAGWLWRTTVPRPASHVPGQTGLETRDTGLGTLLRYLGLTAAVAVCVQAVLGGLTVIYRLPVPVSVAHACLGQVFFCLNVAIAVLTSPSPYTLSPAR